MRKKWEGVRMKGEGVKIMENGKEGKHVNMSSNKLHKR